MAAVETHSIGRDGHAVRFHKQDAQLAGGELVARLPAAPESPGCARRLLADALSVRGCQQSVIEAATLVLSELASNAVRHVGSSFSIGAALDGATLRLAVEDRGSPRTAMIVHRAHGLGVVDALASSWGVEPAPRGKVVWAELTCVASAPRRGARPVPWRAG